MKTPRLVVVGSVNADMVVKTQWIPKPGETVTGGQFVMAAGGKGANQAVAAARLGAQVTFVAKVGQDMFGDQAIFNYQKEVIDTRYIVRDLQHATGVALIMVDDKGENLISVASGANYALTPADVDRAAEPIRAADMVMLQLEIPMDVVEHTAAMAAAAGVPVILNPAPAAPLSPEVLRHVTYLTPNESEAERLTGMAVNDDASARAAAQKLLASGVQCVILTMGAKGALLVTADEVRVVPAFFVEARDTTAAGDAFCGGLACAIARGASLFDAVREASLVAAFSVTRLGAQPSLPTTAQLQEFAEKIGK